MIRRLDLPVKRMNISAVDGKLPGNTELGLVHLDRTRNGRP